MDERVSKLKTAEELLEMALVKEKQAYGFYEDIMNHGKGGVLREFAMQLQNEEYKHIKLIEKKLAELQSGRL